MYHLLNVSLKQRVLFPASDSQNKGLNKSCCQTWPRRWKNGHVICFIQHDFVTPWPLQKKTGQGKCLWHGHQWCWGTWPTRKKALSNDGVENQNQFDGGLGQWNFNKMIGIFEVYQVIVSLKWLFSKPMSHGSVQTLYAAMLWTYYGDENDKRRSPKFHVGRTTSPHLTNVRHDTFCTMPIFFVWWRLGSLLLFWGCCCFWIPDNFNHFCLV